MSIIIKQQRAYQKIDEIARKIKEGNLIIYPTETLYGLGCDAYNENAYLKIMNIKIRAKSKSMLILINSVQMGLSLALDENNLLEKVADKFWPGPLTVIVKAKDYIPKWLTDEKSKIAFRISNNKFANALIDKLQSPLISTSANLSGTIPCRTISEAYFTFSDNVDIYIDAGTLSGAPSTIVDISQLPAKIMRNGAIPENIIRHKLPTLF